MCWSNCKVCFVVNKAKVDKLGLKQFEELYENVFQCLFSKVKSGVYQCSLFSLTFALIPTNNIHMMDIERCFADALMTIME